MERNLKEYDSLNKDKMRQRLITLKDEEFYKIMVCNHPCVTDDQSIVSKPTFFFGDAVSNELTVATHPLTQWMVRRGLLLPGRLLIVLSRS